MCVLGTKSMSFARTVHTLNHWAASLAHGFWLGYGGFFRQVIKESDVMQNAANIITWFLFEM